MNKEWVDKAADTIASMCVDYKMGGIDQETFVANIKNFSDNMNNKQFTLFWRDGKRHVIRGSDIASAMNNAGYGAGSLSALDFHAKGDNKEYTWNKNTREWDKLA